MAGRIAFDESLDGKLCFAASPGVEVCFALHCLCFPDHHALQRPWVEEMRAALPVDLHDDLVEFGQGPSDEWYIATYLFSSAGFSPFEYELAHARTCSLRQLVKTMERDTFMTPNPPQRRVDAVEAVARDACRWRDRACALLHDFWHYFLPTWYRLEIALGRELRRMERLRRSGLKLNEWLPAVVPYLAWNEDKQELVMASTFDFDLDARSFESLSVRPSYFVIPHPSADYGADFQVCTWVPDALTPTRATEPADLDVKLRTLASATRLRIVALLAEYPRSATDIAGALETNTSTASYHLRALADAGLIRAVGAAETSAFTQYEINRDVALGMGEQLIDLVQARFGESEEGAATRR